MTDFNEDTIIRGTGRPLDYRLKDGTKVPGVTTVIGRFKESGGLLQWAFQVGKSGAATLYEKSAEAADIGTLAHECVGAEIHNTPKPAVLPQWAERIDSTLDAWHKWRDRNAMKMVATELPLVSERYRFAGTIDAVAQQDGKVALLEFKTSNAVYTDYLLQLAAYGILWDEHHPENPITAGYHLLRFSKEHGDLETRHWNDLSDAREMFKLLVSAYDLDKKVKSRAK